MASSRLIAAGAGSFSTGSSTGSTVGAGVCSAVASGAGVGSSEGSAAGASSVGSALSCGSTVTSGVCSAVGCAEAVVSVGYVPEFSEPQAQSAAASAAQMMRVSAFFIFPVLPLLFIFCMKRAWPRNKRYLTVQRSHFPPLLRITASMSSPSGIYAAKPFSSSRKASRQRPPDIM